MAPSLYLRPNPRAFFLITDTHAVVFRQPDASETKASNSVVVAEFIPRDEVDMSGLAKASKGRSVEGVLGVTSVPTDRSPIPEIFLILLSGSSSLSPLLPSSALRPARVLGVEFHSLSSAYWDAPNLSSHSPSPVPGDGFDEYDDHPGSSSYQSYYNTVQSHRSQAAQEAVDNPCSGMRKYLESGGFFFAEDCAWDISKRMGEVNYLQAQDENSKHPLDTFDERFVWNATLLAPFLAFRSRLPDDVRQILDEQNLLIPVIQGFCGSKPVATGSRGRDGTPEIAAIGLISRLSWKRAGVRFMTRGIDDDGQVANFVETELILATDSVCLSYTQIRGSVPLFWQQPSAGLGTFQQKVEITRPPQASQPAFDKHFLDLIGHYHAVHAVNLLGHKDAEAMLSDAYTQHMRDLKRTLDAAPDSEKDQIQATSDQTVCLTPYDFHAVNKTDGPEAIKYDFSTGLREVTRSTEQYGWTSIDAHTGQVIEEQQGVFRTNCLDCLDRTNFIQDVISSITLERFLHSVGSSLASSPTLWQAHRELWADNGDRLSKTYAGTGALNTSATRTGKKTFAGLLSDATKSVSRAYITNFQDKGKQNAIDMLLGQMSGQRQVVLFDPFTDSVQSELLSRVEEYSSKRQLEIFCGTWNLNGSKPGEPLDDWLFASTSDADIYSIAFQEIVQLTAGQILQTDPNKRKMWEAFIMDTFKRSRKVRSEYLLYRSEQLVGTALIIVVKAEIAPFMRKVESATKKTGLQGLSGNKGGVGIRFDLFDSTVCFMTCHLAAGHSNVAERNADYRTISQGLKFLRGKLIEDHEIITWSADFNYRVSLPGEEVREYAETDQLDPLMAADQLAQVRDAGEVFLGYEEGPISFRPTYKYDNGTDDYDSSEKARIPAWTDRVLFKGPSVRLKRYDRSELYSSDHRPVYAVLEASVREVDKMKKDDIEKQVKRSLGDTRANQTLDAPVTKAINLGLFDTSTEGVNGNPNTTNGRPIPARPAKAFFNPMYVSPEKVTQAAISPTQGTLHRKAPIPPARPSATASASAKSDTQGYETRKRPPNAAKPSPPPIPSSRSVASPSTSVSSATASGQVPPRLPPRSQASRKTTLNPQSKASLDLIDSPPKNLAAPVLPDRSPNGRSSPIVVKRKPAPPIPSIKTKPIPPVTSARSFPPEKVTSSPQSPTKASLTSPIKPKPPIPSRKPDLTRLESDGKPKPVVPSKPVRLRSSSNLDQ